jgi:hypothetical protein
MASFKGDGRYTCGEDAAYDSHTSDEHLDDDRVVVQGGCVWRREYYEEIEYLYSNYIQVGRSLFGGAFHQLGRIDDFANFVFKYMQPGATLSNS